MSDSRRMEGQQIPLMMLLPGQKASVVEVRGGRGITSKLSSMGLFPGAELSIVSGGPGGPVIAEVRGSRVVLGRGMAHRVLVQRKE
ncbi:MAG: ferrous iron transport protein A [Candidatus Brocadiia bacterium]